MLPGLLLAMAVPLATAQNAPPDPGKQVFDVWCGICHGLPNGASGGGTETLAALYQGTEIPAQLEDRSDLTAELIITLTRDGRNTMPNFRKTEISDSELEALVAYLVRDGGQ
ncbi:MAG: cytochrome c [Rhodospirillaceae bacterium]|nr:cytochrome c [Rhodospirillaceae bacterium]